MASAARAPRRSLYRNLSDFWTVRADPRVRAHFAGMCFCGVFAAWTDVGSGVCENGLEATRGDSSLGLPQWSLRANRPKSIFESIQAPETVLATQATQATHATRASQATRATLFHPLGQPQRPPTLNSGHTCLYPTEYS